MFDQDLNSYTDCTGKFDYEILKPNENNEWNLEIVTSWIGRFLVENRENIDF